MFLRDRLRVQVFVSDVKIASAQREAERERSAREAAQTRELGSLRRELRAVVNASVAMDVAGPAGGQDGEERGGGEDGRVDEGTAAAGGPEYDE